MRMDWTEKLLRALYMLVLYLLVPITVYHLVWRGFRQNAYFQRWSERYGIYSGKASKGVLWVHAVSVGEVNAAIPLINALRKRRPDLRLLVTTITPTGSERVRALWGHEVEHAYLPYDLPGAVTRFLKHYQPLLGVIMETEIWPSLLFACRDAKVPVVIVNARLSANSLRGYRVLAPLISRAVRTVTKIAAQSVNDAKRFIKLGAREEQVDVLGNLKFDVTAPTDTTLFREAFRSHSGQRPIWIAASTHEEEEGAVFSIHRKIRAEYPNALLIWAPRHPERFRAVAISGQSLGFRIANRSTATWPSASDDIFLLDTIGELAKMFSAADVAFIGGSLQPIGGHNLLEPAAAGVPTVTGPHLHNFVDISKRLREADALIIADDEPAVATALLGLLEDPARARAMSAAGLQLIEDGKGALDRCLALILPMLPPPPRA